MQKKLIALAVAGAAAGFMSAPVLAQSQVTLYGTFDGGLRHLSNTNAAGQSKTTMDSKGTYNSNRWGMTGSEDMGNGMKANFTLEGGFWTGSGKQEGGETGGTLSGNMFNRKAIVGLSGGWGALDLGRNYNTIFYVQGAYDPFNYKYTGIIPIAGLDGARDNNMITYTSAVMNGLRIRADYSLGEVAGSSSDGSKAQIGADYANGPFNVGAAYSTGKTFSAAAIPAAWSISPTTGAVALGALTAGVPALTIKQWTLGGGYTFGAFALKAGYDDRKVDNDTTFLGGESERKTAWLGGRWAMSAANALSLAYYDTKLENYYVKGIADGVNAKNQLWILGFVHNLSKRTELYADIDSRRLNGVGYTGALDGATKVTQTGISVGINHAF